jgi:acetyl-CoA synthetase
MADANVQLKEVYPVPEKIKKTAFISGRAAYDQMWKKSIEKSDAFWAEIAGQQVEWFKNGIRFRTIILTLKKVLSL